MANAKTKQARVTVMTAAVLKGIIAAAIQALGQYDKAVESLRLDIVSGTIDTATAKEYARRCAAFIPALAEARGISEESVDRNIRRINAAQNFIAPREEATKSEVEQAKTERESKAKAKRRALAKVKAEIVKAAPARKFAEGELEELAKEKLAGVNEETKAKEKQGRANEKVCAQLDTLSAAAANGDFGDGDTRELLAAFVSVKSLIKALL